MESFRLQSVVQKCQIENFFRIKIKTPLIKKSFIIIGYPNIIEPFEQ